VFPVRYELDSYILFRRNSVFKGLMMKCSFITRQFPADGIELIESKYWNSKRTHKILAHEVATASHSDGCLFRSLFPMCLIPLKRMLVYQSVRMLQYMYIGAEEYLENHGQHIRAEFEPRISRIVALPVTALLICSVQLT
jgi:hypothetical protein